MANSGWGLEALSASREARRSLQDGIALKRDDWIQANRYYYGYIKRLLSFIVEPGRRVLDLRCQTGDLLAAVKPSYGVGVEISPKLVDIARGKHPELNFVCADMEKVELGESFDYIVVNYLFDTVDILSALKRVRAHCTPETRVVLVNYNQLWEPILEFASKTGLRSPFVEPNWVSDKDVQGFLELSGFRSLRIHQILLLPKYVPLLSSFLNDFLAKLPLFRLLCLVQVIVARPQPVARNKNEVSVSVIVPCRNEQGNVQAAVERIPNMGRHTEILFCDDKSTDRTVEEIRRMQTIHPERDIRLVSGPGICKAENVWTGFRQATGDILMILDADLTVMPEELPSFLDALTEDRGEFINGCRLIYPIPKDAMKFFNRAGNKVFGILFSYLLKQRFKDTLCGTKVLWRKDWTRIEKGIGSWGIRDMWGDYELILGASKLHLEITEMPVHYQERVYGVTKMTRVLSNGVRMLGICRGAWQKLNG